MDLWYLSVVYLKDTWDGRFTKRNKKYRDEMVARNYPFQAISNIITKYELENPPVAIKNDDRGPLDLTRQLEEKDKEIANLKKKLCQCDA